MADSSGAFRHLQDLLYIPAEFYLLRAPVLPASFFHLFRELGSLDHDELEHKPHNLENIKARAQQSLRDLTSLPVIEQALAVASLSILEGLKDIRKGASSRSTDHTYSSLMRYIIRMSTRPTPFGLFAGIAWGTFAEETTLSLLTPVQQQIRTRPDMRWLLSVVQKAEQIPEVVAQLSITLNQRVYTIGKKGFLPYVDIYGQGDNRFISFDITPVISVILEYARQPIAYTDLITRLKEAFPQEPLDNLTQCLWKLWTDHILMSHLHPPLTTTSPATYVLEHLRQLKGAESLYTGLQAVLEEAVSIDRQGAGASVEGIQKMVAYQEQLVPSNVEEHPPLYIDTLLHTRSLKINKSIGEAAAQAATTLLRLTPWPSGPQYLQEYRIAFEEKFGDNVEVPLLHLLSAEAGLDAPKKYRRPSRTYPLTSFMSPSDNKARDAFLCALVAEAVNERHLEIELNDGYLQRLERWPVSHESAPPSLEIHLQIHATSRSSLDQGDWKAIVSPSYGSSAGGCSFGRYFDLLAPESLQHLQQFIQSEEALYPDVIFAELSYQPWYGRAANIAIRPMLRSYEICVGTTPSLEPERVITLDDLVVGVHNDRFYVRSLRLKKQVIVCENHMLTPQVAPNACRFLAELALDGRPLLAPFDWGTAAQMPFLPRLVQKQVVLSPAQWNLRLEMVSSLSQMDDKTTWFLQFQNWRKNWRVPRYVYLCDDDNRLLLDLELPFMVEELCTELVKAGKNGSVSLQEVLPGFDHLWLRDGSNAGYFSEVAVPLLRSDVLKTSSSNQNEKPIVVQPPYIITHAERCSSPGEEWAYLKLPVSFRLQDELIAGPLSSLVNELQRQQLIDRWFYVRYSIPEPQLRLRFHASEKAKAQEVLEKTLRWSRMLVEQGFMQAFSVDTYVREVERYGGPMAIDIIEQVFTANSTALCSTIAAQHSKQITLDPMAVAIFSLDQFLLHWGFELPQRLNWLKWRTRHYDKYEEKKGFHKYQQTFCDLLLPESYITDNEISKQQEKLRSAVSIQETKIRKASEQLAHLAFTQNLWNTTDILLRELLHMHLNRLLGTGSKQERQLYAFWKYTLERVQKRLKHTYPTK